MTNTIIKNKYGKLFVGIDPGSRYTAIVVLDGDEVIWSQTIKRTEENDSPDQYAKHVVKHVRELVSHFGASNLVTGIEGVVDPKGFSGGKRAAINPKDIIRTGVTFGALVIALPHAIIVRPGKHGAAPNSFYPRALNGRRPADLLPLNAVNASTRRHEKSAYDIAREALRTFSITSKWGGN